MGREELIRCGELFFRDQRSSKESSLASQIIFLEGKGLCREEIEAALLRSSVVCKDSSHLGPAPELSIFDFRSILNLVLSIVPVDHVVVRESRSL